MSLRTDHFAADEPRHVFVDGQWLPSSATRTLPVTAPATGERLGTIPAGGAADAGRALEAARKASQDWARLPAAQRAAYVKKAARRMRERLDEVATVQTREGGKPIADSRGGVEAGIGVMELYAELGPLHRGRSLQGSWDATDSMVFEPRGVVVVLTPWNDPVAISAQNIAAALVAGNTVVFKPSERTPLSGLALADAFEDLPPGVLNVLLGDGELGQALVDDPRVDAVIHVGSTATGRRIAEACARTGAKALLENGGKDALIVDAGVDPAWAARQAASGSFANAGQICTSVERIYVHVDVADAFVAALVAAAESLRVGPGEDPATSMGPLIDERQRDTVHEHVTRAVAAGARLLTGGEIPAGPGTFYPPTVLVDVTDDMPVMTEETFGPVAAVCVVGSYDEALTRAARSAYGLAATVLTPSQEHAQRAWRELPVGTVKINAVWGGAPGGAAQPRRGSGDGFGYGPELLDELTRVKVVHHEPCPPA
jgi:succinate-semialdehyde dehydrogenase/glutarate-semialdehyde dehydrogenase